VESGLREKWSLTQEAFDGLLALLGPDRDRAAEVYLETRRNLVRLFEWRGCSTPDEYADEAINRCARKIAAGEQIRDLPTYCIGVARMLLREMTREQAREARPLHEVPEPRAPSEEAADDGERRLACLKRCLTQISPDNRDLILSYYHGEKGDKIKNRKLLMERFAVPPSTLRMRALRVREALQLCSEDCLERHLEGDL
jgi:DNA-directed RNA polymerase specialized sigma24 family protein